MKIKRIITHNNELTFGKFTVLVGQNNVGKSQFLRDISNKMLLGPNASTTIIKNIEIERPNSIQELLDGILEVQDPNNTNQIILKSISSSMRTAEEVTTTKKNALEDQLQSQPNTDWLLGNLSRLFVAFLNAESRLLVANSAQISYPDRRHENLLQDLYYHDDSDLSKELEEIFNSAFSMN